jgi:hypothetical protein
MTQHSPVTQVTTPPLCSVTLKITESFYLYYTHRCQMRSKECVRSCHFILIAMAHTIKSQGSVYTTIVRINIAFN